MEVVGETHGDQGWFGLGGEGAAVDWLWGWGRWHPCQGGLDPEDIANSFVFKKVVEEARECVQQ